MSSVLFLNEFYDISKYYEGKIITEEQFISASSEIINKYNGPIEFTIKSKSGKLSKEFSAFERENEVLFRAGTKFLVTKNVLEDKIRQIEM